MSSPREGIWLSKVRDDVTGAAAVVDQEMSCVVVEKRMNAKATLGQER